VCWTPYPVTYIRTTTWPSYWGLSQNYLIYTTPPPSWHGDYTLQPVLPPVVQLVVQCIPWVTRAHRAAVIYVSVALSQTAANLRDHRKLWKLQSIVCLFLTSTKLYCLMTGHEQLAQGYYAAASQPEIKPTPYRLRVWSSTRASGLVKPASVIPQTKVTLHKRPVKNKTRMQIIIIIIIKGIYIVQVRKGHKCAMSAKTAVWLRNCLCLYSYLHN